MALQGMIANMILTPPCASSQQPVRVPCKAIFRTFACASSDNNVNVGKESSSSNYARSSSQQNWRRKPVGLWNPFMPGPRTFSQMMDMMNQMMEGPASMRPRPAVNLPGFRRLPWDVMEDENNYMMRIDLPGFTKAEVEVSVVDDGFLLVKGEMCQERKKEDKWAARSAERYESRVMIPENADVEDIKAEFKDGVLYVTVPKKAGEKKTINVEIN